MGEDLDNVTCSSNRPVRMVRLARVFPIFRDCAEQDVLCNQANPAKKGTSPMPTRSLEVNTINMKRLRLPINFCLQDDSFSGATVFKVDENDLGVVVARGSGLEPPTSGTF